MSGRRSGDEGDTPARIPIVQRSPFDWNGPECPLLISRRAVLFASRERSRGTGEEAEGNGEGGGCRGRCVVRDPSGIPNLTVEQTVKTQSKRSPLTSSLIRAATPLSDIHRVATIVCVKDPPGEHTTNMINTVRKYMPHVAHVKLPGCADTPHFVLRSFEK